ncbi:MAG: cobalamin biosynthesis protein CobW [Alphaproteobacteria bacterium]|nr:cobalamin biosynthesis protein CobW [Alphaproteobacteria bacterium]
MAHRIPVTIISGFLGAGKTTLLRHLISHSAGRRLAVIINEFGELGLDRSFVESCTNQDCPSEAIVELANGCICCKVAEDFLPTMETLLAQSPPPDHILIETSGLALPKPLLAAFNWPEIKPRITIDGVITVLDGVAVASGRFTDLPLDQRPPDHDNPLVEVFADQISAADLLLVNKSESLTTEERQRIEAEVKPFRRPGVKSLYCDHGLVPPAVILGLQAAAESDLDSRPSVHDGAGEHDHEDFVSMVITLPAIERPATLRVTLQLLALTHDILRLKGFVAVKDRPRRMVIQAVGDRIESYFDRNWLPSETPLTQLVVIGHQGMDQTAIRQSLDLLEL